MIVSGIFRSAVVAVAIGLLGCSPQATKEPAVERPAEVRRTGLVVLGSPHLFAGVPGQGPLKLPEVRAWLANPEHHRPLEFRLPLGLDSADASKLIPAENPLTLAKIELGRQLFFDRRLSRAENRSCGDCHNPKQAYANYFFDEEKREPAVAFNRLFSTSQFWDGRAESLEAQPKVPLERHDELNLPPAELVARLKTIPGYQEQFTKIFHDVSIEAVGAALACFERAVVSGPAPWDYHATFERLSAKSPAAMSEDERALLAEAKEGRERLPPSESALRGAALFFSERAGCGNCHSGPNFSDEAFHNTGVGSDRPQPDPGRFAVTKRDEDFGAFKTPTLRNLARSGPYFHDGRFQRLEEVIAFFSDGGIANERLSPLMRRLDLSAEERKDLLHFLDSLNGALPDPPQDRLPE